jgi:hypothetical protein
MSDVFDGLAWTGLEREQQRRDWSVCLPALVLLAGLCCFKDACPACLTGHTRVAADVLSCMKVVHGDESRLPVRRVGHVSG